MAATLFDVLTAHCFTCPHTETGVDPDAVHDAMEAHYETEHARLITHLVQHGCRPEGCRTCRTGRPE